LGDNQGKFREHSLKLEHSPWLAGHS